MPDCNDFQRLPVDVTNRLLKETFMPALTADLAHEHGLATQILHEQNHCQTIEMLFGLLVIYVQHQAAMQDAPVSDVLERMGMSLAEGDGE